RAARVPSPIAGELLLGRRRRRAPALGDLALLVSRVAVERARRRELAELVPDHVLRDEHRNELAPVVHREGEPHGVRRDRAAARPGLDDLLALSSARRRDLLREMTVDESALLN